MSAPFGQIRLQNGGEAAIGPGWQHLVPYRSPHHVLYRVLEGSFAVEVDGVWQTFAVGDLVLLTANHWHRRRIEGAARKQFLHFRLGSIGVDLALSRVAGVLRLPLDGTWAATMTASIELWNLNFRFRPEAPRTLVWQVEGLIQHLVAGTLAGQVPVEDDALVARALAYLEGQVQRRPSVAQIAAAAGCSERLLGERFQRALGLSVANYAEQRRMEEAERLLTTTEWSVAEVGTACCYPDPLHFSRVVRRHFGKSPRALRQPGAI